MVVFYALLSAAAFGTADFLGGFSSRKNPVITTVFWSQGAGLLTVLIAAPIIGAEHVEYADILWGMAGGISGAFGVLYLFKGLSTGMASIVSPVAALTGAAFPVLFGFLTGERPPILTWAGVALLLPAITLMTWEKEEKSDHVLQSLRYGLLSGALFGAFFIFLSRTSDTSGMWPLAAARASTVPLFLILSYFKSIRIKLMPGTKRITLVSGFLDMGANVFYLLAARTGYLIIAVILSALYPAQTVVLHKVILREKLTIFRISGLILSIVGAVLIGIGS